MLARKSLIILITTFFIKGVEVAIFYLATNKYAEADFGYLTIARSLFSFFLFFSDLNFNLAHIKKMAEGVHSTSTYFTTYFTFKLILLPVITLSFIILIQLELAAGILVNNPLLNQILVIIMLSSIINSINMVYQGSFQAQMKISKMQAGNVIAIIIKCILTAIIVIVIEDFLYFVSLFLVYELITLVINIFLGRGYRFSKVNRGLMKEYLKFGSFYLVSACMQISINNLGPLILANFLGVDALGVYYVVTRVLNFLTLIQTSLNSLFLPQISADLNENNVDDLRTISMLFQKYMLIIWGVIAIAGFGLCTFILRYLGGAGIYAEQGLPLFLFQVGVSFYWAWSPFIFIMMLKKDSKYLLTALFSALLSIFSWAVLPSVFGILAIDFGKYFSTIPNFILLTYYVQKKYGFGKPSKSSLITLLLASVFLTIMLVAGVYRLHFVQMVVWTAIMLCGFIILLFVFRVLKKEDINYIKNVISPGKMLSEIRSDFRDR